MAIPTPPANLSDIFKGYSPQTAFQPFINAFTPQTSPAAPIAPAVPTSSVTRTLPNGQGSYQSPVISQPTAPVAPTPVQPSKPLFSGAAAPAVTPIDYSKYTDPTTGQVLSPQDYANMLAQRAQGGSIPNYAGNTMTQGPQTSAQLTGTATGLNNQRNDIATGATDPYQVASKSGIAYSPTEMNAIEKAYAGIYDPALKDVQAKLDAKQKQDAADLDLKNQLSLEAQKQKDAIQIKQMELDATDPTSAKYQDKLEQQYRQVLLKPLSNRSGGLGLEDSKVNQAIHLAALVKQYKDANGNYNIPTTQYNELALGLARLLSPTGTVGSEVQQSITQATAAGDFGKALTYITGTPANGSTQDVYKNLIDTIDRQGITASQNRDQYMSYLNGLAPTDLDPSRSAALEQTLLNQYTPINGGGSNNIVSAPDGTQVQITD